jgi:hypothetical protein
MMRELTDYEWAAIKPFLPTSRAARPNTLRTPGRDFGASGL